MDISNETRDEIIFDGKLELRDQIREVMRNQADNPPYIAIDLMAEIIEWYEQQQKDLHVARGFAQVLESRYTRGDIAP